MKKYTFLTILSIQFLQTHAQFTTAAVNNLASGWTRNAFENKVFIENKGQFNNPAISGGQTLFGAEDESTWLLYSLKGLTYRIVKTDIDKEKYREWMKDEQEDGDRAKNKKERIKEKEMLRSMYIQHSAVVNMEWVNANPDVQIIPTDKVTEYFNYGMGGSPEQDINFAKGYKKIYYKDLYPGIDVEYTFHEKEGTKYNLIVHPGADVSKVKMKYTGDGKVKKNKEGNIIITTPLGDIVDHAPVTFYERDEKNIASHFVVKNNIVSFYIDGYDNTKTVIIDPWSVNPAFPFHNKALDIERDPAGNAIIFGSDLNFKLRKYNTAGIAQWTYNTNWFCYFMGAWQCFWWYGDLAVDFVGNSYISTGSSNGNLIKINTAGVLVYDNGNVSGGTGNTELFAMCFNIPRTKLISGTVTSVSGGLADIFAINTINGFASGPFFVHVGPQAGETRGLTVSPNGNYYSMTTGYAGPVPRVMGFTPTYSNIFDVASGYTAAQFPYMGPAYTSFMNSTAFGYSLPGGQSCIAASFCYVYTYDGGLLIKRNNSTGAFIGSVAVTGGTAQVNSGVLVDSCDNVYVGTASEIRKYDANLNFVTSVTTSGAVYDICFGPNMEILACGNGFVASVAGLVQVCPIIPALNITVNFTSPACGGSCNGTATAAPTGGIPPYTYTWSNGQTTQVITSLCPGTYTVTVTDGPCRELKTATVNIGSITLDVTKTDVICYGDNSGSITVTATGGSGSLTYSWSPPASGQSSATATGLAPGNYTVTVKDQSGCTVSRTISITQPVFPTVAITNSTSTNISCTTSGSASVTAAGFGAPFIYNWSTGSTGISVSVPVAGNYTVTVTDNNGCTVTKTFNITGTNPVSATFVYTPACVGSLVNFTNIGTVPDSSKWLISPITPANVSGTTTDFTYTFLSAGIYSVEHTVYSAGCMNKVITNINVNNCNGPTVIATGSSVCSGTCAAITSTPVGGTPPYIYAWNNGSTTQNINPCPTITTTYTLTITDAGGKTATTTATIIVSSPLTGQFTKGTASCATCGCKEWLMVNATGGTSPYSYTWPDGYDKRYKNQLCPGSYTINIKDRNGCSINVNLTTP